MRTLKTPFQIDARGGLAYTISTQDVVERTATLVAMRKTERISCDTTTLVTFSSRWSFMMSRVMVPVVSGSRPDVGSS